MARRALQSLSSLIDGFNSGYELTGRVLRDRDLREVAQAKPVQDQGFTPEQGAQLEAAAKSGQYDLGWDPEKGAYTVTAKSDPASVGTVAPGQRTSFLGQVLDAPPTADQQRSMRAEAQAGVLEQHGDLEGANRVRTALKQGALADLQLENAKAESGRSAQRFDWEKMDRERLQAERGREDAYRTGREDLYRQSAIGQKATAYSTAMKKFEAEKAAYDERVAAGDKAAVPPVAPEKPSYSMGESMLDHANLLAHEVQFGKASPEQFIKFTQLQRQLMDEGYLKVLRMAQTGAPLTAVVEAFNKSGETKIDPASVTADKLVKRDGGTQSRLITFKRPDGTTQTIDTLAELDALGKAGDVFDRAFKAHSMAMQEGQLKVSQGNLGVAAGGLALRREEFAAGADVREANAEVAKVRTQLANTDDPKEIASLEAKLQALTTGQKGSRPGAGADPADVKKAQALVGAGKAPDIGTALEIVMLKPDQQHKEFVNAALKGGLSTPERAVKDADATMKLMGWERKGTNWAKVGEGGGQASFASEAEVEAAAKAGKIKPGDKVVVNGRTATWR